MKPETRRMLEDYYRPYYQQYNELIGDDLEGD
jgi:hypothetical protein